MNSASELLARLADLLRRERAVMADFLVALADFDRGRIWLTLGYPSLFHFLHRELGLAKGPAYYRKTAAELIQRFPEIVEPLRDGRLCLTSVVELAKVITPENRGEVLPRFFHLSKQEAKAVSAEIQPDAAVPLREMVTAVRPPALALAPAAGQRETVAAPQERNETVSHSVLPEEPGHTPSATAAAAGAAAIPVLASQRARALSAEPLTAELSRIHLTVSKRFLRKLEAARAALSHSHPGASADEILEAALDLLLERDAKRKGLVDKPRREPRPAKPHHVPAHVKREVWNRDQGRCQFPMPDGGICGSTHQLEIDHIHPRARGGPSTVENTRVVCRPHNQLHARRCYGDEWMDRYTAPKPPTCGEPVAPWRSGRGPTPAAPSPRPSPPLRGGEGDLRSARRGRCPPLPALSPASRGRGRSEMCTSRTLPPSPTRSPASRGRGRSEICTSRTLPLYRPSPPLRGGEAKRPCLTSNGPAPRGAGPFRRGGIV